VAKLNSNVTSVQSVQKSVLKTTAKTQFFNCIQKAKFSRIFFRSAKVYVIVELFPLLLSSVWLRNESMTKHRNPWIENVISLTNELFLRTRLKDLTNFHDLFSCAFFQIDRAKDSLR